MLETRMPVNDFFHSEAIEGRCRVAEGRMSRQTPKRDRHDPGNAPEGRRIRDRGRDQEEGGEGPHPGGVGQNPLTALLSSNLTRVNLSRSGIVLLPKEFWELKHLTDVDLSHNELEGLGGKFAAAATLAEIDLSHNRLRDLPEWINLLPRARRLRLNDNPLGSHGFRVFDRRFGRTCRSLRLLDVSNCALTGLHNPWLFEVRDLREFTLGSGLKEKKEERGGQALPNCVQGLPGQMGQMVGLTALVACGLSLSDVPEELGLLRGLRILDLTDNEIYWLPSSLASLSRLEVLRLGGNRLDSLPHKIEELGSLRELYADRNSICWVTEDIGRLRGKLEALDLYDNRLDEGGAEPIGQLDVAMLDLGRNPITLSEIAGAMSMPGYPEKQAKLRAWLGLSDRQDPLDAPDPDSGVQSWDKAPFGCCNPEAEDDDDDPDEREPDETSQRFSQKDSSAAEEKSILSVAPRAAFLWDKYDSGDNDDDAPGLDTTGTDWVSEDSVTSVREWKKRRNCRPPPPRYDFDNMSKYCTGTFKFCPSDLHPGPVLQGRRRRNSSDSGYLSSDYRRPGRKLLVAAPTRVPVCDMEDLLAQEQFEDAEEN